ncbi:MAG: hypothetical protein UW30_C0018G0014 [Candidatus Giovannonibacteria bacterium GW2011_GWA2_44_13b]|uniref:Uncharacterized protein n=2 Tax=Candidatus Giovannoniibacteriota TaxID=1752738 RepID=A0A0G1JZ76_9BACT|nr:MAG: hypothetical protein UW30_C0018G0014 [Candidatus Giovannonibacteria bacterium GW2011_GWA2_44_13b]OGF83265.1 MAG: hypothetical protein A2924_02260 [Candidatus Giovannonibacteria bacterium RIFCSPLOWO2_01_FULL_44_16]
MFILITDKDGVETYKTQTKRFGKRTSLREAVRYSIIDFLKSAVFEKWEKKTSFVLDRKETKLIDDVADLLYGPGQVGKFTRNLLDLVAVDTIRPVLFGDGMRFRVVAENVCWKDTKGNDHAFPGISIYRVKQSQRH